MYLAGGPPWERWNNVVRERLCTLQAPESRGLSARQLAHRVPMGESAHLYDGLSRVDAGGLLPLRQGR